MNKAQRKVLKDLEEQKDESKRMREDERLIWKIRGYITRTEYWIIAFDFPISILIALITQDYWKGIVFYAVTLIYHVSANIRGLTLHVENYIEWKIKKTI